MGKKDKGASKHLVSPQFRQGKHHKDLQPADDGDLATPTQKSQGDITTGHRSQNCCPRKDGLPNCNVRHAAARLKKKNFSSPRTRRPTNGLSCSLQRICGIRGVTSDERLELGSGGLDGVAQGLRKKSEVFFNRLKPSRAVTGFIVRRSNATSTVTV